MGDLGYMIIAVRVSNRDATRLRFRRRSSHSDEQHEGHDQRHDDNREDPRKI
jgi:hypothetical protein